MRYLNSNPSLEGDTCPVCKKYKGWNIFKCDKCGKIFCKECEPNAIHIEKDDDTEDGTFIPDSDCSLVVTCPNCGDCAVFI